MLRSLRTRDSLWTRMYSSPSSARSLTSTHGRTACQGWPRNDFSSFVSRPFGVPTRECTGASPSRIVASVASVGMPRSMIHTRSERPYCFSIFSTKPASVVLSEVLPGITS